MDISELLPYAVIAIVLVSLFAVFVITQRSPKRWVRWSVLVGAGAGIALTVLVLAWLALGDLFTERAPLIYSPDGKHVAVLTGTWAGPDAEVNVRRCFSPFAKEVYSGRGFARSDDPQVRWLDNKHLLIRYHDWHEYGYEHSCAPHAFGIEVTCEEIPTPVTTPVRVLDPIQTVWPAIQMVGPKAICDAAAEKLREAHTSKVVLLVTVNPSGGVESFETLNPKGLELDKVKEAASAINTIRFQPTTKDSQPVRWTRRAAVFDCSRR